MKTILTSSFVVLGLASMAQAQTAGQPATTATISSTTPTVTAVARSEPAGDEAILPANTQVDVTLNQELNSKKMRQGETFAVSVSHDVMLGNYIVIPRGTRGNGHISYRTGKGAFGKSAKMEIEIIDLDLNGRSVPVSGKFRQEGQGNTGATVGAVVAVGVLSAFVTGHSAVFEQGRELRVFTRDTLPVKLASANVPTGPAVAASLAAPAAPAAH